MASSARKRRKRRQRRRQDSASPPQGAAPEADAEASGSSNSQPARDRGRRQASRRRGEAAERPLPPWGSFPLSEIAIFVGAIMLVIGFFAGSGPRQATLLVTGFIVASLGALEVSLREHLAGYRSHTLLLAGVPAVVVLGLLFYFGPAALTPPVRVAIGGAVYAASAWLLVAIFRARSGGYGFRLRAPRRR